MDGLRCESLLPGVVMGPGGEKGRRDGARGSWSRAFLLSVPAARDALVSGIITVLPVIYYAQIPVLVRQETIAVQIT